MGEDVKTEDSRRSRSSRNEQVQLIPSSRFARKRKRYSSRPPTSSHDSKLFNSASLHHLLFHHRYQLSHSSTTTSRQTINRRSSRIKRSSSPHSRQPKLRFHFSSQRNSTWRSSFEEDVLESCCAGVRGWDRWKRDGGVCTGEEEDRRRG